MVRVPPGPAPSGWPALSSTSLALNRMGSFDWDLDSGRLHLDTAALSVFDLRPEEYDGSPGGLTRRIPREELPRLGSAVRRALDADSGSYSIYFRGLGRDGAPRWIHTQGCVLRDPRGRSHRVIGILRDATREREEAEARDAAERERERQSRVVQETTAALANALTVADVTDVITGDDAMARFGADALMLGLVEAGRIVLTAASGMGWEHYPGELGTVRVDAPLPMGEAVRTQRPVFVASDAGLRERYPSFRPRLGPSGGSAAFLPLVAQARPIGVLGLGWHAKDSFGPEERNLLLALGSGIAQSLQRAMLHDQARELAAGLQTMMLPRRVPHVPGARVAVRYRAASAGRDIGGDWYDVVALPRGRVGAVVGDVQGHDTHAAAVMGQLRIAMRAYASEGHAPGTVLARASRFLAELDTDRFATCVYVEADMATGSVHAARAGHLSPLLRHASGPPSWPRVRGGLPLGLSADFGRLDYPETRLDLAPGDTLLLCTDGLVERPGADLAQGLHRLAEGVRDGPEDLELLADRLCRHLRQDPHQDDDMVLLLLRRDPDGPAPARHRVHQHVSQTDPEDLAEARHLLRETLLHWGLEERAADVEAAAGELVTNALLHTDGGALVTLSLLPGRERRLRVEVVDRSSRWPRRHSPAATAASGRGLLLVEGLADRWGVEPRGTGKSVWCEFDHPPARHDGHRPPHGPARDGPPSRPPPLTPAPGRPRPDRPRP